MIRTHSRIGVGEEINELPNRHGHAHGDQAREDEKSYSPGDGFPFGFGESEELDDGGVGVCWWTKGSGEFG